MTTPDSPTWRNSLTEGTRIDIDQAIAICRLQVREQVSFLLRDEERFYVHAGFDCYLYADGVRSLDRAIAVDRGIRPLRRAESHLAVLLSLILW
jgi:hypothetical protein